MKPLELVEQWWELRWVKPGRKSPCVRFVFEEEARDYRSARLAEFPDREYELTRHTVERAVD